MASVIKVVSMIIFVALIAIICTTYATADSDDQESDSQDEMYSLRELLDMLIDKRGGGRPASALKAIVKAGDKTLTYLGKGAAGTINYGLGLAGSGAASKAAFSSNPDSSYTRYYDPKDLEYGRGSYSVENGVVSDNEINRVLGLYKGPTFTDADVKSLKAKVKGGIVYDKDSKVLGVLVNPKNGKVLGLAKGLAYDAGKIIIDTTGKLVGKK